MEIYTLDCPIENIPKYIGFTSKSLNERLKEHLRDNRNTKKCSWIKNLKNKNMIPIIKIQNLLLYLLMGNFFETITVLLSPFLV